LSYINSKTSGKSGTNRTTQAEISNLLRPSFPGRVTIVGTPNPAGWGQWGQPPAPSFAGVVAGPGGSSCNPNGAFGGSNFWCDGAVEGYDGLWQKIATTPGATYDVSFYLGDNSGQAPYNPGIDMFVYAGDSLPAGTENLPEPSSLVLMGSGVLAMAGVVRKKLCG
jgi:PEP-CTERM motif